MPRATRISYGRRRPFGVCVTGIEFDDIVLGWR